MESSVSTGSKDAPALRVLESLEALRDAVGEWDDLWARSDRASPLLRADGIEAWCRRFAPGGIFRAAIVAEGGRPVAALPVVARPGTWPRLGQGPNNHWSVTGDLLADREADPGAWAPGLAEALERLPWSAIIYRVCPWKDAPWDHLILAARRRGWLVLGRTIDSQGSLRLGGEVLDGGTRSRRRHRKNLRKALRLLEEAGGHAFRAIVPETPEEVGRWMRDGFAIEDSGWKGREGSSVLRSPGMADFYIDEARRFAARGDLMLFFLELGGKPIAFQYAYRGKDAVFLSKVGYREAHARFSPGQVLNLEILEHLPALRVREVVFGSMTDSLSHWVDACRPVGNLVLARRDLPGAAAFAALRTIFAWKSRRRGGRIWTTEDLSGKSAGGPEATGPPGIDRRSGGPRG